MTRALLVVPPFAAIDRPALGVHLLQALGRARGAEVNVLYANLLLAAGIGLASYQTLSRMSYGMFLGERLFSRAAFGNPPLGRDHGARVERVKRGLDTGRLLALEALIPPWVERVAAAIVAGGHDIVGCSTSFEQTGASLAILNAVKSLAPRVTTILGGANCEGEMAEGMAGLSPNVDVIFEGESERTFVELLAGEGAGRIRHGAPCERLDELPTPDFTEYDEQARAALPGSGVPGGSLLPYETSRGCWWGQKHHCTFCGLNGLGMRSREKSPDRVLAELKQLLLAHPSRTVVMTDNIMPHAYFRSVVPRLADELPGLKVIYELKANLSLRQVLALVRAGISEVQPGIEALSTGLLRLMAKGTSASQNLALLRYARATGMVLHWALLFGFPGDRREFYEETLELLPLLRHLPPPRRLNPVVIDRFSPYHDAAERFGVSDLRPVAPYHDWLPAGADVAKVAYHFEGTFASESLGAPALMRALAEEVAHWRRSWLEGTPPELRVERAGPSRYRLIDTRGPATEEEVIDERQATAALVSSPPRRAASDPALRAWALARRVAVERDGALVAIAVADPDVLLELEARLRARASMAVLEGDGA